jgi:sigma-B regulation protein RsbU (phosphoserine phosphatase)
VKRYLLVLLATMFAAATLAYSVAWMYYVRREPGARLGIGWERPLAGGPGALIVRVDPGAPAEAAGLRPGDLVVSVQGRSLGSLDPFLELLVRHRPGEVVSLDVERGGERLGFEVTLAPRQSPPGTGLGILAGNLLYFYPLLFLVVALPVLFLRVSDRNAWLLALLFGGFIAFAPYFEREAIVHPSFRGFGAAYKIAFNGMAPALFYAFFAVFPSPSPVDRRLPWLKLLLLAGGAAVCLPLALAALGAGGSGPLYTLVRHVVSPPVRLGLLVYGFAPFLLGLVSLVSNARQGRDAETRRKARVMLWGTAVGLGPALILFAAAAAAARSPYSFPFWAWAPCILVLLVWPASFGYTVVKHRVLEIPLLLKRSARYLLVQRGVLLLVALVVVVDSLLVVWLISWVARGQPWAVPAGVGVGIAFGLGLGLAALHVQRRVSERIDRAFFRNSYDARRILEDLAQKARTVGSREELAGLLDRHLRAALQPSWLVVYFARRPGRLEAIGGEEVPLLSALGSSARFLSWVQRSGRPQDLAAASAEEIGPLQDLGPECLVPLLGRSSSLLGLVVLGPRRSEEPYSGEDKSLLGAVASQASLALESITMAEEIATRMEAERRVAHELDIAREVQRKLLPQKHPALATLDYAADCIQARVVGGDYWDALDLGPGRFGLVLADISGKGISAALLMANLQASLRSRPPEAFFDLPHLLKALNRHLNESTESSRYATLVVAVYDDVSRRLRFANCGHIPPLLLRAHGAVERLLPTAPVVGLFEEWEGTSAEVDLHPEDALVFFTDGVTDAVGPGGEEFGEARLLEAVRSTGPAPAAPCLQKVLQALADWGKGTEQWDDQTLLLARVR